MGYLTITIGTPYDGQTEVAKTAPIKFAVAADSQVTSLSAKVRGAEVYSLSSGEFADGWRESTITANGNGFDVVLSPDLVYSWHNAEVVPVVVNAATSTLEDQEAWSFTAERSFRFSIYPFLLRAVRERDDKDV